MYNQLVNYRDELKMNSMAIDGQIYIRMEEQKIFKTRFEDKRRILREYENSFEKLKFKERDKLVKLRDSMNKTHKLNLHFDTSNYSENVSDTVFNRLMEIDFYRLRISFQNRYMVGHRCM